MRFKNLRKYVNDFVEEKGNALTPKCLKAIGIKAGDILTADVGFRAGLGVLGALTPLAIAYSVIDLDISSYKDFLYASDKIISIGVDSMALGFFGAIAGYELGEKIDEKLKRN